ncbi:MAG: prepilin peptidase [Nitrosospira sp.]|nr:prepilin peptidase [Nitrosospira sp.]
MLVIGFLLLLLLAAAWHDSLSRRIPNALVFPGAAVGVLSNGLLPAEMGGLGILDSLGGMGVGLVALLPLYLLRAMAAGDVKLMAMTGAFLGIEGAMGALLCVLLAGGVLALWAAWCQGKLRRLLHNLRVLFVCTTSGSRNFPATGDPTLSAEASVGKLPYGVAIAAGTVLHLAVVQWS